MHRLTHTAAGSGDDPGQIECFGHTPCQTPASPIYSVNLAKCAWKLCGLIAAVCIFWGGKFWGCFFSFFFAPQGSTDGNVCALACACVCRRGRLKKKRNWKREREWLRKTNLLPSFHSDCQRGLKQDLILGSFSGNSPFFLLFSSPSPGASREQNSFSPTAALPASVWMECLPECVCMCQLSPPSFTIFNCRPVLSPFVSSRCCTCHPRPLSCGHKSRRELF